MYTPEQIAELAARWWADQVVKPTFDNGDTENSFGSFLGQLLVQGVSTDQKEKFTQALKETIQHKLNGRGHHYFILSVDYHPDGHLQEAAEKAGISFNNFPWKTTMWISEHAVKASLGYSSQPKYLYADKAHWENEIESVKESIATYENDGPYWMKDMDNREERVKEQLLYYKRLLKNYEKELEKVE